MPSYGFRYRSRSYKRKRNYKPRQSRRASYISKRQYNRRKRYKAVKRLQGKVIPFSKAISIPDCSDTTISKIIINENEFDVSLGPSQYSQSKVGNLTNILYYEVGGTNLQYNLQQCFENLTPPVIQDFHTMTKLFQWSRFEWIRVTLIPDSYEAAGPDVGEPEYPLLHVINDNASGVIGVNNTPGSSITIDVAQTLPNHQYKQYYFNKPIRFNINLVEKLNLQQNPKNVNMYSSATRWAPTMGGFSFNAGTEYIPNDNFYFGFSQVPANFSYKVKLEAKVKFKQMNISGQT